MKTGTQSPRPLIAWVEDNQDYQNVVREWLLPKYDVVTYENGDAFLSDLEEGISPDLLMLDVQLPGPDGFRLCRALRSNPRFQQVPILFLTACGEDAAYVEHLDAGGTALLAKPIGKRALLSTLAQLVDGERCDAAA